MATPDPDAEVSERRVACDALVLTHRWFLPDGQAKVGSIDRILEHLLETGRSVALLEHPLTTMQLDYTMPTRSRLSLLRGGARTALCEFDVWPSRSPWRWAMEAPLSVRAVRLRLRPGYIAIASDPLSARVAGRLRAAGVAAGSVFLSSDYAERRFASPLLNRAYQWAVRRNLAEADIVLCLSRRMRERFAAMHPGREYVHFPTAPDAARCPHRPPSERNRADLVLLGVAGDGMRHEVLIGALARVAPRVPELRLHVIGGGGGERAVCELARAAGLADRIVTHGFLPRVEALERVSQCAVGVVFYDAAAVNNTYRDSLKIREYAACGLPVVCDSSTDTAEEAHAAGVAFHGDTAETAAVELERLLTDPTAYAAAAAAARAWAVANDKRVSMAALLQRLAAIDPRWKDAG